ncbi:MAG: tyrosine-type recombinase/integrase, partial [Betaproteobacteria bacterium]|nr:tyrosine-type recombinase/integrase [Betaproteobacteria bacterium]
MGKHADGRGLYLIVRPMGRVWAFIFTAPSGKRREMHLGHADAIGLKDARGLADQARLSLKHGTDPLDARNAVRTQAQEAEVSQRRAKATQEATLRRVCRAYHERIEGTFRNHKHRAQWIASLENHVFGALGDKPIATVTPTALLDLLQPLVIQSPETGRRVRQRLESVFDDAALRGLCIGNPAAVIRRQLKQKREKGHFRALPYAELPALLKAIRTLPGTAARAFEFTALTAGRTSEVLGLTWAEIGNGETWTVPARRMKAGEPHIVHLSCPARAILARQRGVGRKYVFSSPINSDKPISNMAMLTLLRRLNVADKTTVHGLRAAFSTWANEHGFRPDVIEACLAHREGDRVR